MTLASYPQLCLDFASWRRHFIVYTCGLDGINPKPNQVINIEKFPTVVLESHSTSSIKMFSSLHFFLTESKAAAPGLAWMWFLLAFCLCILAAGIIRMRGNDNFRRIGQGNTSDS